MASNSSAPPVQRTGKRKANDRAPSHGAFLTRNRASAVNQRLDVAFAGRLHPDMEHHITEFDQVMGASSARVAAFGAPIQQKTRHEEAQEEEEKAQQGFKRVPAFAVEDDGIHGLDVGDHNRYKLHYSSYWDVRIAKLKQQRPNEDALKLSSTFSSLMPASSTHASSASSSSSDDAVGRSSESLIFRNCTFYFDGFTGAESESALSLTMIARANGAVVLPVLSRSVTTHIISPNLSLAKHVKESQQQHGLARAGRVVEVVKSEWIFASLRGKKMVSTLPYRLISDSKQSVLNFSAASNFKSKDST